MSKFHSMVSRRDFMKGLGVGAAGLGAAAVASPVFRDLDELQQSSPQKKRPWYVKERDFENPTVEIDWSRMKRRHGDVPDPYGPKDVNVYALSLRTSNHPLAVAIRKQMDDIGYVPGLVTKEWNNPMFFPIANPIMNKLMQDRIPGFTVESIRDVALYKSYANLFPYFCKPDYNGKSFLLGFQASETPAMRGTANWSGTPEENTRMLRATARLYGYADIGVVELNENTKKLIMDITYTNIVGLPNYPKDKKIVLDTDDAMPAETATEIRIPSRFKWLVTYARAEPEELIKRSGSWIGGIGNRVSGDTSGGRVAAQTQEFLRGIGYTGLCLDKAHVPTSALSVLSGIGEHVRSGMCTVSPELGMAGSGYNILTDLPMAPSKPIDAGANRFCYTCKLCAESCPTNMLMMGDPTFDPDPEFKPGVLDVPYAYKGWFANNRLCLNCSCSQCVMVCPMNNANKVSPLHHLVGVTTSITPVFNSFFRNMDKTFGYNNMTDPASWWDLEQPVYGVNPKW